MDPIQEHALRGAMESAMGRNTSKPGIKEVGNSFSELFENVLVGANKMQVQAKAKVDGLLTGEVNDIHEVMVAFNQADLSFRFMVEMRNKLQDAYQELMTQSR